MNGKNMEQGFISTLQFYSTKDGPGIRTSVFCVGCNLRCAWCANPELVDPNEKYMYYKQRCIKCGTCVKEAPQAITLTSEGCIFDRNKDIDWEKLLDVCPKDAYEKKGYYITSEELAKKLLRDKEFYQVSNGGVTFSGGEAALQYKFVKETAHLLHQENIHVTLDTAGLIPWEHMKEVLEEIDLVLYDIKAYDENIHLKCTKTSNKQILENALNISKLHKDMWIRLVIVPSWNDDLEDIRNRFKFIKTLGDSVKRVDVLKYHNLGTSKYEQLGYEYVIDKDTKCSDALVEVIQKIADEENIKINIEN